MSNNNIMASLEAMLFAAGDPVEPGKLAEVLDVDVENVIKREIGRLINGLDTLIGVWCAA